MAVPGLDAIFFRIPIGATGSRLYHQETTFTESVTEKNKLRWIRSVSPDEGCKLSTSVENVPHIRQQSRRFATTRWSLVVQARECTSQTSRLALEELCSAYWLPIYAFFRHQSGDYHEAQDLTQGFFASLLQHDFTAQLEPSRGRFRAFLIAAAKHFLSNERTRANALKRGGGMVIQSLNWSAGEDRYRVDPSDTLTAENLYEREWAVALLARVLDQMRADEATRHRHATFDVLSPYLSVDSKAIDYRELSSRLNKTPEALRVAMHRLRKRFRKALREEVSQTTSSDNDVAAEMQHLFQALGS